jgi:hypothetical protein
MNKFRIEITDVPYREKLIAEIWFEEIHVAEINQETQDLEIEIFPTERVKVPLRDFREVIENAVIRLGPRD